MNNRDCWATPPDIFAKLHARYHFTLDVCATMDNAKLPRFISPEQDGFMANWGQAGDTVWCNPPYSHGQVRKWLASAMWNWKTNGVRTVMLLNYCCDAEYFQPYLDRFSIVHITPRIQFIPPPGIAPSSNSKGQILAIAGMREQATWWNWKTNEWGM